MTADALMQKARDVRLLTCDVDGVLTDGSIYVDDDGRETKAFSALDGVGMKMLMKAGITVAWITGSKAPAVTHRARALGIARIVLGAEDKLTPWDALRSELRLPPSACAHIGDDLPDVPVFVRCGFAIAAACAADRPGARAFRDRARRRPRRGARALRDDSRRAGRPRSQHAAFRPE
jgi:3-deoxy-D-manno-octulosonate 8-phosphate phosphatase (KDO 8-P phosphatase)